jgi:hypothetical protein
MVLLIDAEESTMKITSGITSRSRSRKVLAVMAIGIAMELGIGGCLGGDGYGTLDVRTYQLEYIQPGAAHAIIDPYVFADRGGMISIDDRTRTITVRETPEMLGRIGEVLKEYDRPEPSVRLHFRIIEANGGSSAPDPALEDIAAALPTDVFRFKNYRQVGEAVMMGIEFSNVSQRVGVVDGHFVIEGFIGEIKEAEDGGTVQMQVELLHTQFGPVFETTVNARLDQLLVLGSAQPEVDRGALILAVKAELVRN